MSEAKEPTEMDRFYLGWEAAAATALSEVTHRHLQKAQQLAAIQEHAQRLQAGYRLANDIIMSLLPLLGFETPALAEVTRGCLETMQQAIDGGATSEPDLEAIASITLSFLKEALKQKDWKVRAAAVQALGRSGEQAILSPLKEALSDQDTSVRSAAIHALGLLREGISTNDLLALAQDEANDWFVRDAAVTVLERLGKTQVAQPLREGLEEELRQFELPDATITEADLAAGVAFWNENASTLKGLLDATKEEGNGDG